MLISDLLGQYYNSTHDGQGKKIGDTSGTSGVQKLVSSLRDMGAGTIFEGTVNSMEGGKVMLGLSNGQQIPARLDGNVQLNVGQSMFFQIKTNDGAQIAIRPFTIDGNNMNLTLMNALGAAKLPTTGQNLSMVNTMMQEQMPIDAASLGKMARMINANPDINVQTLVQMNKFGIPINKEMAAQFENYMDDKQAITKAVDSFIGELPQVMSDESMGAGQLKAMNAKVLSIITEGLDQMAQGSEGSVINGGSSEKTGAAPGAGQTGGQDAGIVGQQLDGTQSAGQGRMAFQGVLGTGQIPEVGSDQAQPGAGQLPGGGNLTGVEGQSGAGQLPGGGNLPGMEGQPGTGNLPGMEGQPGTGNLPGVAGQPGAGVHDQAGVNGQLSGAGGANGESSGVNVQPGAGGLPGGGVFNGGGNLPGMEGQPGAGELSGAGGLTGTEGQSGVGVFNGGASLTGVEGQSGAGAPGQTEASGQLSGNGGANGESSGVNGQPEAGQLNGGGAGASGSASGTAVSGEGSAAASAENVREAGLNVVGLQSAGDGILGQNSAIPGLGPGAGGMQSGQPGLENFDTRGPAPGAGTAQEAAGTGGAGAAETSGEMPQAAAAGQAVGQTASQEHSLTGLLSGKQLHNLEAQLKELPGLEKNTALFEDGKLKPDAQGAEVLRAVRDALLSQNPVAKRSMTKLFGSKAFGALMKDALEQQWMVKPQEVAKEGSKVNALYEKLEQQMSRMEQVVKATGQEHPQFSQAANEVRSNVDFMNNLNNAYTYVQIPLKMSGQNASGELFVYTNKKSLARQGDKELTAFLHLDLDNLGSTDVSVRMKNREVSTDFYLADDASYALVQAHLPELEARLKRLGYSCKFSVTNEQRKVDFVEDFLKKDQPSAGQQLHRYSFDMRA